MLSLLIEPFTYLLKSHIALSGMNMTNTKVIESSGLDIESNISKIISGKNSLGIVYNRGKLVKQGRDLDFVFQGEDDLPYTRKGFSCTIPFELSIVTDQLAELDTMEVLHRMYLTTRQFDFNLVVPGIEDQVEKLQYTMYYADLVEKAGKPISGNLKDGFRFYNFSVELNGYLLAPYITEAEVVSSVDFKIIPYSGTKPSEFNGNNSHTVIVPKEN